MSKKIILTGGGTAGHVMPNLALVPSLKEAGFEISYIGSKSGMERELVENAGIPFHGISSGKLRRYFDLKNFTDPFRIIRGYFEARRLIKEFKPDVIFSKGGFVSVPVVYAAGAFKIPVVSHESDLTPGLANKLAMPRVKKICYTFPETEKFLGGKGVYTGSPVRASLFDGDRERAIRMCGFTDEKPVLLVTGGSLGAAAVNEAVRTALPQLLEDFNVIHLTGRGKSDPALSGTSGYAQFEFADEEMKDMFAAADIVISRAGANSICEIVSLKKPNILIPLPSGASRGDQILNARSFEKQGFSVVLMQEDLTPDVLVEAVKKTHKNRASYILAMEKADFSGAAKKIRDVIVASL